MKIKSCLKGIALWVAALTLILSPCLLHAACEIVGTIDGGYIVSCTGETGGFCIGVGNDIITVELGAEVSHAVQQFVEAIASANAIAIDAGGGNNQVTNYGSVGATAEANALPEDGSASQATATTTAIKTGDNRDVIQNFSTITSTATSNSESGAISMVPDLSDLFHGATSGATAKGVDAGSDDDQIVNTGTINAAAEANADLTDILLPPLGSKTLGLPPKATAHSTGVEGGAGNDRITNSGTVYATAVSSSESLDISLTLDLEGGATSEATAEGINANEGDDQIINTATINAEAEASASSDAVVLNLLSIGTYATPTTATASSTGIDGGKGADNITNNGDIIAKATSSAEALSVTVSVLQYEVASDGDARTESVASATGIAGGDGDDKVTNTGTITATTHSTASTTEITVEGLGASRSNSSTTTESFATGINGGAGNDEISNSGTITASATSEANSVGVDVKYISLPLKPAEWFGADLGDAKTAAQATAAGIEGGEGDDTIVNSSTINVSSNATASSDKIVAMLNISSTSESKAPQASASSVNVEVQPAAGAIGANLQSTASGTEGSEGGDEIFNTGTIAQATASGITGGVGNDSITNNSKIYAKAESEADSLSMSATIAIGKGSFMDLLPDTAIIDAATTAQSTATGIEGGSGNDTITNGDELNAEAIANATSASIGVLFKGVTKFKSAIGIALSDATTKAFSTATGIAGGDGEDTITNSGKIKSTATSDADSASISVALVGLKEGLVTGVSYADATTTAKAASTGIDSGGGNNVISSTDEIEVTAGSTSSSASIGLSVSGALSQEWSAAIGIAITDGTTKAISSATGIKSGDDTDSIATSNRIKAAAISDADSASISVALVGEEDGFALGVSYADTTTTAEANAVGIDSGSGNDTLTNTSTGQIEVMADPTSSSASVSATITGVTKGTGIVGGAALTDGTTKAIGNATGISGGEGDDTIINFGKMIVKSNPDADSASVSVTLGAAMGELGLVGGFSYADATTTAQGTAIGIEGGAGNDAITNTGEVEVTTEPTASSASIGVTAQGVKGMGAAVGISLTDGTTKAISTATGVGGGEGNDTIANSGKITVKALSDADSASVSVSLSAAKEGVAAGGTFADTTTTAQATATGIEGGEGNDTIANSGMIEVAANSEGSSASVSFSAQGTMTGATLGIALTDGTTKAISTATGIRGGGGDDTITNSNITKVTSTADVAAASVSVNAGIAVDGAAVGAALADGKTVATSSAIGLEGGAGNDTLTNRGSNTVSATSEVTAASVAVSLEGTRAGLAAGVSLVDGENRAGALAIGIRGGDGNDTIGNDDTTWVDATTTSVRTNVSVTGTFSLYGVALGASAADATNIAAADARGIEGGEGNDTITNTSDLVMGATTSADTTSVSVSANVAIFGAGLGASLASAETTGSALATGIDGGEGDNTIMNTSTGSIKATATAHADTVSVSVNLIGAVKASADSTATASSIGMRGGKGTDFIQNDGTVTLAATSDTDASSYAAQLIGLGESNAKGISNAMVKGIDGGDGNNTIINTSTGVITGTATALADASSYDIQLSGGAKATAGTVATATTIGIAGGKDINTIRNEGTINLAAGSTLVSESRSYKFFGVGIANADSKAETIATGIDGGEGISTLTNASTGSITVSSNASVTANSFTANLGVAGSSASTTSKAHSTGVKSGDDQDAILNEGNITVTATSNTGAAGGSFSLAGFSFGDSFTEAIAEGINARGGNDTVINTGSITAGSVQDNNHPMAYSEVASVSFSLFGLSSATFGSKAQATGIIGGEGDEIILNAGTITVGDDDWMAKGRAYGFSGNFFEFFSLTDVGATAETIATGIEGGDGNDTLLNDTSGVLTVKATSYAEAEGAGDTTFGSPAAFASSTTKATATGINGGEGDDVVENKGTIDVYAHTLADAYTDSWAGWGSPKADSSGNATATALGVDAGKGQNSVTNSGAINATSLSETRLYAKANSDIDTTDAEVTSYSRSTAFGIQAGDDGNTVNNTATGAITVTATARTYDAQGNITKAESDEEATAIAGSANSPITANGVGISLGTGDDTVANDGTITVSSLSDARVSAYSNSWPYDAQSDATAHAAATTKGIAVGVGANEVINNGQINVSAWSHANPITDSWSRDQTAVANATADSNAVATGIEADGNITNTPNGSINVTARATTYADANTNAETTTATASLMATATGIRTASSTGRAVLDRIQNDGIITVNALAGEDENGNPQMIALADTDVDVRSDRAEATGTSTVDAAGIRVGDNDAWIFNNGDINVTGRARASLSADAFSRDYNPTANAHSNAVATAVGVQAEGGSNAIRNGSLIDVDALAEANAQSRADSWSSRTYTNSYASAIANATGVSVGDGDNLIVNEGSGSIDVHSNATGTSYSSTDENAKVGTSKNDPGIKASATATGISAGGGNNQIINDGNIKGEATATGDGNAFAESDAFDTETIIWAVVDARATGIAAGSGNSQITNNGLTEVISTAIFEISSDSDSVDDADATGGGTTTAKAWGINVSGNNALVINAGVLDVNASATAKGNSRADSGGDGYGEAIFETNSNADAIGISAGDGGLVWNQAQAQITADAKAMVDASANGDEFGTMGTNKENPGAIAVAKAVGISMGEGDNQIVNDGSVSVSAEGNINVGTRSLSTTRSTHTSTWARADSTATGFSTGKGNTSITNTGGLEVDAKAIAYLNDPNSGWGTYWRSDSWYNADAKTGAYAYSDAKGIDAGVDNSDSPGNTVITNSGTMKVSSAATAKGNAAGDRGGTSDGTATTYAEATADASGFVVGSGNKLVSIENSGTSEVKSTAETLAFSHGDSDSWSYAKSLGYAYGIKVGDNNELVSIKNSGTMKVESTALSDTADDEPWRQSDASSNVYGIDIGNSNSDITNSGVLDIKSTATATLYTDENTAVSTVSSAYATGISTGNGTNTISNDSQIQVIATAESNPDGGNLSSTNRATAQAIGIKTGSNNDTITLGTSGPFNVAANATTFSYNGVTNASAIGIDVGDGANQITNHGTISVFGDADAEVRREEILWLSITYPATAVSNVTGIKSGQGADIINNYGEIMVNSNASAVINQVLDWSAGTKSATANATGIDAGNGDNFVGNYGSINVSGLAAAGTGANPRSRTDGVENTTAIGIKTGDGNDTIINSGTINTANQRLEWVGGWIHIVDWPGIAITSGAGNDQVFLMDGSEINGHIDLGDGDDWLTFVGNPLVEGDVTGAAGTDTLAFEGAGNIGFTPMAFENAIKQGTGTFTVASLPTMQRVEVNQGTLQIKSNYAMANGSTFQAQVNGDGSHGQLEVNGTTTLGGALKVIRGPGAYLDGTTYDILTGDVVNGWFTSETLPEPTPLVSFLVNPPRDHVEIEAQVNSFTTVSNNPTHSKIATYLDRILPTAKGDLAYVLGEIQLLSEPGEFNTAFSSLSPVSYDNYTRGTLFTAQQYAKSLQYRMNNVRSHIRAGSPNNEKPILLAYSGSDASLGQLFSPGEFSQIQGKSGLWLDAFGQWGDQDEEDGYTGYDYYMRGATLGFDHRLMDKLMAGLSLGYSRSDIDLDRSQGDGDVKSLFGSLYGSYFDKNLYIDAILSYGWNWYDSSRLITIGGILRRATSDHDAHLFSGYLGGGYYFDFNPFSVGPYGSLQYIYLDEESFEERGAGGISLRVDDRQTDALVSELGLRMLGRFKGKCGNFIPEVSLAWSHDFDIDDHVVKASFAGSPGASFSIEGQDVKRNGLVLGAGLTFIHKSGFSTSFRYKGELREGYKSNGVMGEIRYSF